MEVHTVKLYCTTNSKTVLYNQRGLIYVRMFAQNFRFQYVYGIYITYRYLFRPLYKYHDGRSKESGVT